MNNKQWQNERPKQHQLREMEAEKKLCFIFLAGRALWQNEMKKNLMRK
jgi:hypothetical protein